MIFRANLSSHAIFRCITSYSLQMKRNIKRIEYILNLFKDFKLAYHPAACWILQRAGGLQFAEHPLDRTAREGESVRFACRVTPCMPMPASIVWSFQGKPVSGGDVYRLGQSADGSAWLDIADVYMEDAGVYTVRVTSDLHATIEATAVLTVTGTNQSACCFD